LARSELGLRLEAARLRAKKTQADVAEAKIFGLTKLREIERGIQADAGDVFTLCRFYEVGREETAELISLADMAKSEAFWEDSRDAVPGWFELYLTCEQGCQGCRTGIRSSCRGFCRLRTMQLQLPTPWAPSIRRSFASACR
jgi:transcriptional regulator with XRE-family HTH domain